MARLTRRAMLPVLAPALLPALATPSRAGGDALERWLDVFQPSTLSRGAQRAELAWFIQAARPFRGQRIKVVSEILDTHVWESKVLAAAFSELTGIQVQHETIPEGNLVRRIHDQMLTGRQHYDAYINDSDLIGTHWRYGSTVVLSDWMKARAAPRPCPRWT